MSPLQLALFLAVVVVLVLTFIKIPSGFWSRSPHAPDSTKNHVNTRWHAPDTSSIPRTPYGDMIRYGQKLIANTAYYLGPKGIAGKNSNAMNCQNCHLNAGAKPFGNSFSGVASIYPVFRARSGIVESIEFRINDCMQRSMNGHILDTATREMHGMVAYLKWIGRDVPKGTIPEGAGIIILPYLERPSDTLKGKIVYENKCKSCHGKNGAGIRTATGSGFVYPPLWGPESYNTGAGLFRLGRFAGFVRSSMPFGTQHDNPQLTIEEAWDVAAFVNSRPRPEKPFPQDWPDLERKSIDFPFGPYADRFSETEHKYGPYGPIEHFQDSMLLKKTNTRK